ncbi:MAG: hypothetical protein N4A33_07845 [Bacteriovoracaceae bacterium]|jgi:3-phosphoshikimate 1-carboxyvinyltransferase|nr:hypothetical protein [Bacteriovoracaceae bacterium]
MTILTDLPISKSYANRALVKSFLMNELIELSAKQIPEDVSFLYRALVELKDPKNMTFYLGEGGTSIRFFIVLCCAIGKEVRINVHERFMHRPYMEFIETLNSSGCSIKVHKNSFFIKGQIKKNIKLIIDCSRTTQYYSALLLVKKYCSIEISPKNINGSKSYIELTKTVINERSYKTIPVDMSSLAYFVAYAHLNQELSFSQVDCIDYRQADSKIFDFVEYSLNSNLKVYKNLKPKGINVDVKGCPDLTMALVYIAIFSDGISQILGIDNLKYKEVDRIEAIKSILLQLKVDFSISSDSLKIKGQSFEKVKNLDVMPDHRIVMMGALILKQFNSNEINNKDCVAKSFPHFFKILETI